MSLPQFRKLGQTGKGAAMKIAIIGSGAAGSVFASYLKKGGADVYLVDLNQEHLNAIKENGLHFVEDFFGDIREDILTGFHTATSAAEIGEMDAVILMVKTTANDAVLKDAQPCIGPETVVISLQNGLGNELKIREYVPEDRILYGNGDIGTELLGPGVCRSHPLNRNEIMFFGPVHMNPLTERVGNEIREIFVKGGCKCLFTEKISSVVWKKAMRNIGHNCLYGLIRISGYYQVKDEYALQLIKSIWREGCEVAAAKGVDSEALWDFLMKTLEYDYTSSKDVICSTGMDMLVYHKKTEIDNLNGAIVQYGKELGIPTPVNEVITLMVKAVENNYEHQFKV